MIWRQLDPPAKNCHSCFKPKNLEILCSLPPTRSSSEEDARKFRENFKAMKNFFSSSLVRPVYEALSDFCCQFVTENRLKYGDVLLSLTFQDSHSKVFEIKAKQVVFRKWSFREEMSLQRALEKSKNLVKLALPGKATEKLLILISNHCL